MNRITTDLITSETELEALRSEWEDLWLRRESATPFQSPAWLIPWWQHFGGSLLRVITVREGERLIGFCPFFVYPRPPSDVMTLCLMGSGVSDYLDILCETGKEARVLEAICPVLRSLDWEYAFLQDLHPDSPLLSDSFCPASHRSAREYSPCSYRDLPETPEAIIPQLPFKTRRNLRRSLRDLSRAGDFRWSECQATEITSGLEILFRLHGERWRTRGEDGVLDGEKIRDFHQETAPRLAASDMLSLGLGYLDSQPIAAMYTMIRDTVLYVYLSGFDPQFQRYSPGAVGLYCTLESAVKRGVRRADLLRGDEEYKSLWGVQRKVNYLLELRK